MPLTEFLKRFHRYDIKLWLVFFASTLWLFPAAAFAATGVIENDTNAIILGILGLLGAVITLLGGIIVVIKTLLKQRSPQIRDSSALSEIARSIQDHEKREEKQFDDMRDEIKRDHIRIDELVRDWARP